jgi:hypothetical protein
MIITLGKYYCDYGQEIIFEDSGHKMIIGIASDGSTYLNQSTWLPVVNRGDQIAITVSQIKGYDESHDVLLSVKTDILFLRNKFQLLAIKYNIEINLHVDKTILDNYRGKIEFGFWLVNVLDFSIRHMPGRELAYCSDNLARALYDTAKEGYDDRNKSKEERRKKRMLMKKQVKEALVFTAMFHPRKRKLDIINDDE